MAVALLLCAIFILPPVAVSTPVRTSDPPMEVSHLFGVMALVGQYYKADRTDHFNVSFNENSSGQALGFVYYQEESTWCFYGGPLIETYGEHGFFATRFIGLCRNGHICGIMCGNITEYFILPPE